ncbi:putative endonuclease [Streptoalloteichus tenebrarius]|uniref:UPF0102 protein LX15_004521 n=1 Tax=Streptoalloteichus tenebrarius (strain ATCC 17920 / DSM 40477 / JCM 4838 / CBS 697.72 / NBRC 16177 / NCIMB 11028 / NRRL B-12390 / A12253. 1 / ISP 5477) TaxID=1933 RepID=A0ABT1HZ63_STRSD|nr:YraN family protein [Streptoalloteichus tenebrarius]MCP2260801.1 putative endonuclease [Streptoalloteichus tenebrarius]BFF03383.1 YraN family protein [Streptoalloteichus tenebrarius]
MTTETVTTETVTTTPAPAPGGTPARRRTADLGRRGEDLAAAHLERRGLVVLSRNWRCRDGELDIVATDGDGLVFCEVKTRAGPGWGQPVEVLTEAQRRRIHLAALAWMTAFRVPWCPIRFDLVGVTWPHDGPAHLQHVEGAF